MAEKTFPTIGIGATYYGAASGAHLRAQQAWLQHGIPVVEMHGCAYPEMSRGEICRQAVSREADGLEVVVLCDSFHVPSPETVFEMARRANNRGAIVSASLDRDHFESPQINPQSPAPLCSLAAIPVRVLRQMSEQMSQEEGTFFKTPFSTQLPAEDAERVEQFPFYPLFSPFDADFQSIRPGYRVEPDCAFLLRAEKAGVPIVRYELPAEERPAKTPPMRVHVYGRRSDCSLPNFTLCLATFGGLDLDQQKALWELRKAGLGFVHIENCPYIDVARELLVEYSGVLRGQCDGVFMLDHDIAFIPQDAVDTMTEAHVREAVVGVPYCMRKTGHNIIGAFELPADTEIPFFDGGDVFPAAYTGMGFTAIAATIIEQTIERMCRPRLRSITDAYPLFALKVENGFYAGEDVSFCARVHDLRSKEVAPEQWEMQSGSDGPSGKIWLDTRKRIFHKGIYHYGIEDAGIAVPRVKSLRTSLVASGAEARSMIRNAGDLSAETRATAMGLDASQPIESRHPLLGDSL